jgi:hypothetical protein
MIASVGLKIAPISFAGRDVERAVEACDSRGMKWRGMKWNVSRAYA